LFFVFHQVNQRLHFLKQLPPKYIVVAQFTATAISNIFKTSAE
jgi:hypothetical protein